MSAQTRSSTAPVLTGVGVTARSFGLVLVLLAAMSAFGLDRSGYPVFSALGHPAWIYGGALLGVIGGVLLGYGCWLLVRVLVDRVGSHTIPDHARA